MDFQLYNKVWSNKKKMILNNPTSAALCGQKQFVQFRGYCYNWILQDT